MEVNDEVAASSADILAWMDSLEKEDRPRVSTADVPLLVHYAGSLAPESVLVEIGTGWGGTAAIFYKVCHEDVAILTIDNGSNFQRFGPAGAQYDVFIEDRFVDVYGIPRHDLGTRLHWMQVDSTEMKWGNPTIDLLFIDGAHSYEGVRGDIENMAPNVVPGGIVIFHDYHMKGVKRAVDEFLRETGLVIENRAGSAIAVRKGQ